MYIISAFYQLCNNIFSLWFLLAALTCATLCSACDYYMFTITQFSVHNEKNINCYQLWQAATLSLDQALGVPLVGPTLGVAVPADCAARWRWYHGCAQGL